MNFIKSAGGGIVTILQSVFLVLWAAGNTPSAGAQPAASTPAPAIQTPPAPSLSMGAPALSLGSTAPGSIGTLNSATNLSISGLSVLLTRFQDDLDQLLPVLGSFNNSFDFVTVGPTAVQQSGVAANFGSNLSGNFSSNIGSNLGANIATPALPNSPNSLGTNVFGLPSGFGVAPVTSETLRALIVLQSDLERLRPTLSSLNGNATNFVGIGLTPGYVPGPITNVFGVPVTGQ